MTDDQRWRGFVDFIDEPFITGWAFDARNPNLPLLVQITAARGKKEIARADIFRQDLKDHGIGDGRHGFVADLQNFSSADGAIEISILGSDHILANDIHLDTLSLCRAIPPLPNSFSALMTMMAAELRIAAAPTTHGGTDRTRLSDDVRSSPNGRPLSAILLETANPDDDPDGLISKFLNNEVIRSGGTDLKAKLSGTAKDRMDVLLWYIGEYSLRWGRSLSVPLSQTQLRFLNAPLPVSEFPASVTVALWNLLRRNRPDLLDVTMPEVENEALYWWCFEKTPQLNLERKLVTPEQTSVLQKIDSSCTSKFPLSTFMRLHIARTPELQCLNLHSSAGRLAALHYFLLLSCKHPYVANLLPPLPVRALLASKLNGVNSFEDNLSFLLQDAPDASTFAHTARLYSDAHGVAISPRAAQNAGSGAALTADARNEIKEGVTVIGPIDKTSGLGQATRLSYQILEQGITPSLSALPFNVENPALVGFSSRLDYHHAKHPHRVNLFHLNSDFIPISFSILDRSAYENSYNIGYFFWEINKIPESHLLALELLDEIWTSSDYVREIYAARTHKPVVNVGMAVENLPPHLEPHRDFCQDGVFTFLTTFDSFSFVERKNPLAAVRAFKAAFDKKNRDVALIIKTWNRNRVSNAFQVSVWRAIDDLILDDPRIRVIDETFTYEQILSLKLACDCYVSLHRAEGFGFGMLEAMQLGRPVIATGYSGNMDFCTPKNSYLVDYDLVSVGYDEYLSVERGSVWADPNIPSAAAAMLEVVSNRDEAKMRGLRAAQFVRDNFSVQAIASRYRSRLHEIWEGFGM
ncbi:glycosyltransferase family 1 protein [Methylobacterium sp. P1-11]|uniref:glycosyltransferase family 4 protein n=1 Tax=Methylobacterium sp. P1-11 TaxID=2024616 RepID=UPI0011F0530B|nr:glycosyltransferase family 4 protein [Methylobacterium sp. P1-11]KAA0113762.1 glycosyltransferase family 1 protein [Methylobacterium sp. P1-11]